MKPDAVVRPMREADLESVQAIEAGAFTTPWSVETFRRLLDRPAARTLVLEMPGAGVVGYAVLWCILDQGELANIALREQWRGRGLGALLLDRVLEEAKDRGVRNLFLEVRESNTAARGLYESRDFVEVGRRRDYYDAPREDARVLEKRL